MALPVILWAAPTDHEVNPEEAERHLQLDEVVVSRTKNKYSKKNNPAVDFVEKVMAARNLTDPRKTNPYYGHELYERIKFGIIDFPIDSGGRLGFLHQYLDESPLSGGKVLNLTVKEKVSNFYYQRDPESAKEVVRVRNRHGIDDLIADANSMQTIFDDVLRPVDLYASQDIVLLRSRFVSPLGSLATDFYKYYLSDTIADAERGDSLIVLSFVPHNPAMQGFNGRLYVVKGDSTMFIRRAEMRLPKAANVNYITDLLILQEYGKAPDGSRLKLRDDLLIEAAALGQKVYAGRTSVYGDHSFTAPADTTVFSDARDVIERHTADVNIVNYRPLETQHGEANMDRMIDDMRSKKAFRYSEKVLRAIVDDQIPLFGRDAKFAFGPLFSTLSHNDLEGWRLRGGLNTTAKLSPRWFGRAFGAYGFSDHRWKYGASVEYSFDAKEKHEREFPVRSIKVSHSYDVDKLGQSYSGDDFIFNSITFAKNNLLTYKRATALEFEWETYAQLGIKTRLAFERQEATRTVSFIDGYGQSFGHFNQALAMVELRWAPGEKYYQSSKKRLPINHDAPIIRLKHTFSPKGLAGARFGVNKTEASVLKRFWFSAWGHLDIFMAGGHVWSRSEFPYLLMPEANISYIYNNYCFSLMKAMEFVNDSYASLHVMYSANGALLNYLPLIKKLKLREVVGFHSIWGHLSSNNNPADHPELLRFPDGAAQRPMGKVPYMEFNVGIDNIFTCLRVDYVHRINYLGQGIARNGVRVLLHFTF